MTLWNTCLVTLLATMKPQRNITSPANPRLKNWLHWKLTQQVLPLFLKGFNFSQLKSLNLCRHIRKRRGCDKKANAIYAHREGEGKKHLCGQRCVVDTCTSYYPWPLQWNSVVFLHGVIIPLNISCIDSDPCTRQGSELKNCDLNKKARTARDTQGRATSAIPFLPEPSERAKWPVSVSDMRVSGCARGIYSPVQACSTSAQPFHQLSYSGQFIDLLC